MLYIICLFHIIPDFVQTFTLSFTAFIIYIFVFYKENKEKSVAFSVIFFGIIGSWSFLTSWWIRRVAEGTLPTGMNFLVTVLLVILALLYFSIFRVYFRQVSESMMLESFSKRMWNYSTLIAISPSVLILLLVISPPRTFFLQQLLTFFAITESTVIFPLLYQMGRSAKLSEENSRLRARSEYYQSIEAQQQEILNAQNRLQDSAQSLSQASEQIDMLLKRNGELEDALNAYKDLEGKITGIESGNKTNTSDIASLSAKLKRYEAQNPDDWRLAECYFLVNNAMQKAVLIA